MWGTVESFLPATKASSNMAKVSMLHMAKIPNAAMEDRFDRWRLLQNILDEEVSEDEVEALVDMVVKAASADDNLKDGAVSQHEGNVQTLERLYLPDPDDDEDALTSLWDTIAELHGREGVKMDLKDSPRWPYICCLCRILLHYDFLTKGISEKAIAIVNDTPSSDNESPHHEAA